MAHSSRVQPTVPEWSRHQELEAAGHTSSTARKSRMMNAGSLPASFLHEVQDASLWNGDAHRGLSLLQSDRGSQKLVSRCYKVNNQY